MVGYVRVSTEEQSASVEAQTERIARYCELYGLDLERVEVDQGVSGRTLERPAVRRALTSARAGDVSGIVVAKLDRLTRSVRDLGDLVDEVQAERWALYSVGDHLDATTATGRMVINMMGSIAQWERETISERTRAALAVKRAHGVHLGRRPEPVNEAVLERIRAWRAEGRTYEAIVAACEDAGLPTPRGARWHPTTVARLLARAGA